MKEEATSKCKICENTIDLNIPHFILTFNKEAVEDGSKKVLESVEGATICEECGKEGINSVLRQLKIIHDSDTELTQKMKKIEKSVDMISLVKDFGITGEKVGISNQYLAKCPFHDQESSFLIDGKRKEYFCFCEGLKGDIFSFVINYDRDVNHNHTTLKQAVDFLMEKYNIQ
ncbi:MAG: CHC2 zinc finger domain-containing protein [Candidatus Aminicenantaceae bacterium]